MWKFPSENPSNGQLIIIVMNYKIIPDVMVYRDKVLTSGILEIKWANVQAWMQYCDIPLPVWLKDEMDKRSKQDHESLYMASIYRSKKGDLFGDVVDPDDVAVSG